MWWNLKNKMRTQYAKNKMTGFDLKNKMSVEHQKNKMSVVEGDNRVKSTSPRAHQNIPHHLKPKLKTEIGFCSGISFCILSVAMDTAILSVLFNIILIIGK